MKFFQCVVLLICCHFLDLSSGLHFVAVGDWGTGSDEQQEVAQVLNNYCGAVSQGCDFIVSLGDNFYMDDDPIQAVNDTRFDTLWKDLYSGENIRDLVWYMSVGNHDHTIRRSELVEVEYGELEPRWYLPWLWYDVVLPVDDSGNDLHFIVYDTAALLSFKYNPEEQEAWFNETVANSTATWKIVFGHHPHYSAGRYPGYPRLHSFYNTMVEADVDLYMNGHDHNMQHVVTADAPVFDYVVSGSAGRRLYEYSPINERYLENQGRELLFFAEEYGFTGVTIDPDSMLLTVEHFTYNATTLEHISLYSFSKSKI